MEVFYFLDKNETKYKIHSMRQNDVYVLFKTYDDLQEALFTENPFKDIYDRDNPRRFCLSYNKRSAYRGFSAQKDLTEKELSFGKVFASHRGRSFDQLVYEDVWYHTGYPHYTLARAPKVRKWVCLKKDESDREVFSWLLSEVIANPEKACVFEKELETRSVTEKYIEWLHKTNTNLLMLSEFEYEGVMLKEGYHTACGKHLPIVTEEG